MDVIEQNGIAYPRSRAMQIDRWDNLLKTLDLVWPYVTNWTTAVDAGAYVGRWSNAMAERFDRVFAFEPIPTNYKCLVKNAAINVAPIRAAISDGVGALNFIVKAGNFGEHSEDKGKLKAPCLCIDSLFLENVGFIKLDVEKLEIQALEGAIATIERDKPVICIETKWNKYGIREWLTDHGYKQAEHRPPDEVWVHD